MASEKISPYVNAFISVLLTILLFVLAGLREDLKDLKLSLRSHIEVQTAHEIQDAEKFVSLRSDLNNLADIVFAKERRQQNKM